MDYTNIKTFLFNYWRVLGLMFTILVFWLLFQSYINRGKELDKLKSEDSIKQTIDKIDKKLEIVTKHEQELYPKLQLKLAELENKRNALSAKEKQLIAPNKERITKDVQKLTLEEVNLRFRSLGYDTIIRTGK